MIRKASMWAILAILLFSQNIVFERSSSAGTCFEELNRVQSKPDENYREVIRWGGAVSAVLATYGWEYFLKPGLKRCFPGTEILLNPICDGVEYLVYGGRGLVLGYAARSSWSKKESDSRFQNILPLAGINHYAYVNLASLEDDITLTDPFRAQLSRMDMMLDPETKRLSVERWSSLVKAVHDGLRLTQQEDALRKLVIYLQHPTGDINMDRVREGGELTEEKVNWALARIIYFADQYGLMCNESTDYTRYSWDKISSGVKEDILTQKYLIKLRESASSYRKPSKVFKEDAKKVDEKGLEN